VVAEAVKSFQLNIALFDEVEELSQKHLLAPTLFRGEINVPEPAEVPKSHQKTTKKPWAIATSVAVAVAAVAVGAFIYKRVQKA
jgi:hypothetical protein